MNEVKVLAFKANDAYLVEVSSRDLPGIQVLCDGKELFKNVRYTTKKDCKFQYKSYDLEIKCYSKKGCDSLSVSKYLELLEKTKLGSSISKEQAIKAFDIKEFLKGYKPVYKENKLYDLPIEVVGYIEDIESPFINIDISTSKDTLPCIYYLNVPKLAETTYRNIVNKYSSVANFEYKEHDKSLRFEGINGRYVFTNVPPFDEKLNIKSFTTLDKAKAEEKRLINLIKNTCYPFIFTTKLEGIQKTSLINELESLLVLKDITSIKDIISNMVERLKNTLPKESK